MSADADVRRRHPAVAQTERIPVLVWTLIAGLAFSVFSGYAAYVGLPISLDHPLLLLAIVLLVLSPDTERLRFAGVYLVMGATLLWTFWSWLSTGSLLDRNKAFAFSDTIALPFVLFVAGPLIFRTVKRRDLLLKLLICLAVYEAYVGVFQMIGLQHLIWPAYAGDPLIGINHGRATGTFGGSEGYGMTMALCFFGSGIAVLRLRGWWRLAAFAGAASGFVGVALCLTRSVWLGAALGLLLTGVVVRPLRRWFPVVVTEALGLILLLPVLAPSLAARFDTRLRTEGSVYDRVNILHAGLSVIEQHPLFGIGWGRFLDLSTLLVRQADGYPLTNSNIVVHNVFIGRAAETGIPGAVLWALAAVLGPGAVLLTRLASREMQAWRLFAAVALVIWIVPSLTSPNPYPLPNYLIWLIGGIASRPLLVRITSAQPRLLRAPDMEPIDPRPQGLP